MTEIRVLPPARRGTLDPEATMLAVIVLLVLMTAAFAAVGRRSVPAAERLPVGSWTTGDVARNVLTGMRVIGGRQQALWDVVLDDLQPWRRDDRG